MDSPGQYIIHDTEPANQVVLLEYQSDRASRLAQGRTIQAVEATARNRHRSLIRSDQLSQATKYRGLARAAGSEQNHQFTRRDRERNPIERQYIAITFADCIEYDRLNFAGIEI